MIITKTSNPAIDIPDGGGWVMEEDDDDDDCYYDDGDDDDDDTVSVTFGRTSVFFFPLIHDTT